MSVRISAHDWVEGGITPEDAVEIAKAFKAAGADLIDCSSGQVSKQEKPVYGRMFQTPFADRIRQEAGIPTIAVGAISEADHANRIIAAGRADLCAVARPHLANPAWTLTEAAKIGYTPIAWPKPYCRRQGADGGHLRPRKSAWPPHPRRAAEAMMSDPNHPPPRHALVTGGGQGIGAAIAQALVQQGAGSRCWAAGSTCCKRWRLQHPEQMHAVAADVSDADQVAQAFEAARQRFGPVHMLINNAGQAASAPFLKTDLALWNQMLAVNLTGTMLCTQAALPDMLAAGWGRVVNVASTAGLTGYAYVCGLLRRQTWGDRPDPVAGAGAGEKGHHGQRRLPWLHRHRHRSPTSIARHRGQDRPQRGRARAEFRASQPARAVWCSPMRWPTPSPGSAAPRPPP